MANEITPNFSLNYTGLAGVGSITGQQKQITQVATGKVYSETWQVGTSEENKSLPLADIGSSGSFCFLKNTDATNYVQIGYATTVYSHQLKPGEFMWVALDATASAIYAKANTAAVPLFMAFYAR